MPSVGMTGGGDGVVGLFGRVGRVGRGGRGGRVVVVGIISRSKVKVKKCGIAFGDVVLMTPGEPWG